MLSTKRYYSLDVFRGATVCLMILVNNPGTWSHIYDPLEHAPWHGLTPTDLVFPFFLFAVGNALAFVMPRLEQGGDRIFWKKVITRSMIIFLVGLFLTWWPFMRWTDDGLVFRPWEYTDEKGNVIGVRILGVLPRIALCYFFSAIIIYYLKVRGAFLAGLVLLLLYWLLCIAFGEGDPFSIQGWFGTNVDKAVLGEAHMYKGERVNGQPYLFDPEGIMSTLPAIVQVIFGYVIGDFIRKHSAEQPHNNEFNFKMLSTLFVSGVAFLVTGFVWDTVFPINKKIWTSSYTVYTTGLAVITLGVMIYFIEYKRMKNFLTSFFDVFGKNALFVFALSAFLPKGLALIRLEPGVNPWNFLYRKVFIKVPGAPELGSLLFALWVIFLMWGICYWMDKKRIYIKV